MDMKNFALISRSIYWLLSKTKFNKGKYKFYWLFG